MQRAGQPQFLVRVLGAVGKPPERVVYLAVGEFDQVECVGDEDGAPFKRLCQRLEEPGNRFCLVNRDPRRGNEPRITRRQYEAPFWLRLLRPVTEYLSGGYCEGQSANAFVVTS